MEATDVKNNVVEATQIRVNTTIKTPKITRNKAFQVVTYLNENGQIVTQFTKTISYTMLSVIINTQAGDKLVPEGRGKHLHYDFNPDVMVTEEAQKEYDERKKTK